MKFVERVVGYFTGRRASYNTTFRAPAAHACLEDLARFCRANETTFHPNERTHALLEGRREVWLRIQQHLQLSEDELWRLVNPAMPKVPRQETDE